MNYLFILAQVFGLFGSLSMIISMWQKTRKKMLWFLTFDNVFYTIHYMLLGAYAGAVNNVVGLFRTFTFGKKNTTEFYKKNYILYIVIALYAIFGVVTYDGISSLFPAIAAIIYCVVIWLDNPKNIRMGTAFMLLLWLLYNIGVKSYVGIITEGCLLISTVIAIVKIDILKIKEGKKKNVKKTKKL